MKKFRKSFFATLAFIMTLSALQTNIYALNHVLGDGEDPYVITFKSPGERIAEIKTAVTYNDTQKNLAIEKILKKEQEKNSNNSARVRNTTASDYSYTLVYLMKVSGTTTIVALRLHDRHLDFSMFQMFLHKIR